MNDPTAEIMALADAASEAAVDYQRGAVSERYMLAQRAALESRIRSALSEQWQPAETAPTDGTWVLVFDASASRTGANFMVCRSDGAEWESADDGYRPYMNPTHWRPLPAAPSGAAKEQM